MKNSSVMNSFSIIFVGISVILLNFQIWNIKEEQKEIYKTIESSEIRTNVSIWKLEHQDVVDAGKELLEKHFEVKNNDIFFDGVQNDRPCYGKYDMENWDEYYRVIDSKVIEKVDSCD